MHFSQQNDRKIKVKITGLWKICDEAIENEDLKLDKP